MTNILKCPKAIVKNNKVSTCDLNSPEVKVTKKGECIHQCPKHGLFKILCDGRISWHISMRNARWSKPR